jgi:hypothetical protein
MVYISKVYTKFGDAGDTMLASGDTVRKDSARVAAYGDVDELGCVIGLLRVEIGRASPSGAQTKFLATSTPASRASSRSCSTSAPSSRPARGPRRPSRASTSRTPT